jgi:O-acetyl-ADP-ribose deacetylase
MAKIELTRGDITEQDVDAIVNAANKSLMGGGGVDGAIHRRGGIGLLQACKKVRSTEYPEGLPTGKAVATTGGNLKARWVIHTVGPVYQQSEHPEAELRNCHLSSLQVADKIGAKSVAFPAISTGAFGFPVEQAAEVSVRTVQSAATRVEVVRFVLYDEKTYQVFKRIVERVC